MAKSLRPRRGSSAQHAVFVGDAGELTVDTSRHSVVVHDGVTPGGFDLKRDVEIRLAAIERNVGKASKTVKLSSLNVLDGDTVDVIFDTIFGSVLDGMRVVIDVDVVATRSTGWTITANDFTLEWEGSGHVYAPNITGSLFRLVGQRMSDLVWDPEHDINSGEWYLPVSNTANVQYDDLIGIFTDIYFNGTGVAGFESMDCQDWLRVRSVSASDVRGTNAIWFDAPAANIIRLEHYRTMKRTRVINPRITGPANGTAQGTGNGQGPRAFLLSGVVDFKSTGGKIVGFPGYAYQITRYDNAWIDGLVIDSGELVRTTRAYYGVVHEGGRHGRVSNCVGRNIRRVADTGGGGGLLAIDTHHENIRGEMCNGSAAGTHHGKNYTFKNVTSISSSGAGMVIRSKDNNGTLLTSLNDNGQALSFIERSEDSRSGCGVTTITNISCTGGYDTGATRGASVKIAANGSYDLQGNFHDHTRTGIAVTACHVSKLKITGSVKGRGCRHNVSITEATTLENVDICNTVFDGSLFTDVRIAGTLTPSFPARNIRIENNRSNSECTIPISINDATYGDSGYLAGETISIENNVSTRGSGTTCLVIGNYSKWTTAPRVSNNFRMFDDRYSAFSRGSNLKTMVGSYSNAATLPVGLTFLDGDYFEVPNPNTTEFTAYECIFAGTCGTITGVTATTTAGGNTVILTGNSTGVVGPGTIITIAGSGVSVYRVSRLSEDLTVATLSAAPTATLSGAAVQYRNPTFKGKNALEP